MAEQRISIGNVGMTSQGAWSSDHSYTDIDGNVIKGYETGDTVTANNSIYESLVDGNTAPLTDTTKWRLDVDGSKVAASITNANDAAAEAKKQAESASAAAAQANGVATNESNREQSETERKAAEAQRKTDFQSLSDSIASQFAEMKRLQDSILNAQSVAPMASVPASIYVKTERTANVGETINIAPTLFAPSTCNHSVIYKVYSGGAKVDYKGDVVLPSEAGDSVIEVIPALNNGATKVVTIHAVAPTPILDFAGGQITDENGDPITA